MASGTHGGYFPAGPIRRRCPGGWRRLIAAGLAAALGACATADSGAPVGEARLLSTGPATVASDLPGTTLPTTTTTVATTTTARPAAVVVVEVVDGDTIRVELADGTEEPVRLIGIDAPEPGGRMAAEAAGYLADLVLGKEVLLVSDVSDRDRFDRLLRYVVVDGLDVNEEMVRSGLAVAARYPPDTARADRYEQAQAQARAEGLGGWAAATTSTAPPRTATVPTTTILAVSPTTETAPGCHPSYEGACLPIGVEDVDCAGGSGNGPYYVQGPVRVVGWDEYGLDRDGDGIGCEP